MAVSNGKNNDDRNKGQPTTMTKPLSLTTRTTNDRGVNDGNSMINDSHQR